MRLVTSFENIFVDSVHNSALLNDHIWHLFVDLTQISHLLQDILNSLVPILQVELHLGLFLDNFLQMSGVDLILLFLFFWFTVELLHFRHVLILKSF